VVGAQRRMRRNVTIDDVGNVAAFLLCDLAAGITAEITYVDGGFSQVGRRACAEQRLSHAAGGRRLSAAR
jgi:enoyl-[acyl-carrier-protein] reductase (NADH)